MAKVQCYNCKKVTPVVAPKYRCRHCNYPLNKYLEGDKDSEEVVIEKLRQNQPDEGTIHDLYRKGADQKEEVPDFGIESNGQEEVSILDKLNKELKPDEKIQQKAKSAVIVKQNHNPEKQGKIVAGWLVIHTENRLPITYEIFEGDNVIGRPDGPEKVDIRIEDDKYVSRVHAIIRIKKDFLSRFHYELSDDGTFRRGTPSTNGTYINGNDERLPKKQVVYLNDGDTVQVGTTKLVFKSIDAAEDYHSAFKSVSGTDFTHTVAIN